MLPDEFYRKLILLLDTEESGESEELTESDAALIQEWIDHWQSLPNSIDKEVA